MTLSVGFPPVATLDARVLILGSLPGAESLRRREYYGKPQNSFWWIMGELAGAGPALPYAERLEKILAARIALWDVCAAAERPGSLDAAIRRHTVEPNPIGAFLDRHHHVELICFNGGGAEKLFNTLALPALSPRAAGLARVRLPSTSPAFASLRPGEKLAQWRLKLAPILPACPA